MGIEEDVKIVEAALYAADHPLTPKEIGKIIGSSSETYVNEVIGILRQKFSERGGAFVLVESPGEALTVKMRDDIANRLGGLIKKERISRGVMKTLAIIAYRPGITLSKLAELRGSRAYEQVKKLIDVGFVESRPHGKTRILTTSQKFASFLGIKDDMDKIREWFESNLQR
ncbi:MAG: SMC-Scp complex subunit ScpB [Candidatus Hadarchaeales archaeon]